MARSRSSTLNREHAQWGDERSEHSTTTNRSRSAAATIELPPDLADLDLSRALKHALERERDAESYFRFMAERVPDTKLGALFMELAEIEWKHKTDLQAEYDAAAPADSFLTHL